jgi:hypothetical protein
MQDNESAATQEAAAAEQTFVADPAIGDSQTLNPADARTENVDESITITAPEISPETNAEVEPEPEEVIPEEPEEPEEITYHAVQKDNNVTAIWEMQGRKHIRTIDPRSREGSEILRLFTAEEGEEQHA